MSHPVLPESAVVRIRFVKIPEAGPDPMRWKVSIRGEDVLVHEVLTNAPSWTWLDGERGSWATAGSLSWEPRADGRRVLLVNPEKTA